MDKFNKSGNTVEILDTSAPDEGWIKGNYRFTQFIY